MRSLRLLFAAALVIAAGCSSTPSAGAESAPSRGDSRTITAAELANATQLTLLDYLNAERPQWLKQPVGGFPISVYVDDARLGGVANLRSVTLGTVTQVRYYDAAAAQQKFNGRDLGAVIHVITK